jgi:hypothetical protein
MQIKIEGAIYLDANGSTASTPRFTFFAGQPNAFSGYVPVAPFTLVADLPELDPRSVQVAALQTELTKVRAESQARITQIESQIGKLLALEAA